MTFEGWQEQLRRGGLDLAILLAVARGPRYGLEIVRHLEQFTNLVVTEGTVSSLVSGGGGADPLVFLLATSVLLFVAFAAIYVPAYRATRLDPIQAPHVE